MSTHSVGSSWPMATLGERLSRFMRPHWLLRSTCTNGNNSTQQHTNTTYGNPSNILLMDSGIVAFKSSTSKSSSTTLPPSSSSSSSSSSSTSFLFHQPCTLCPFSSSTPAAKCNSDSSLQSTSTSSTSTSPIIDHQSNWSSSSMHACWHQQQTSHCNLANNRRKSVYIKNPDLMISWRNLAILITILVTLLSDTKYVSALSSIRINAPDYIFYGDPMWLNCSADLDYNQIYSIKWFKDNQEMYRFITSDESPTTFYPTRGIVIDETRSNFGNLYIQKTDFKMDANFRCEVLSDTDFNTAIEIKKIRVYYIPRDGQPIILGKKTNFRPNELVNLTCSAPMSTPPARLMVTLNENSITANSNYYQRTFHTQYDNGLTTTSVNVQFPSYWLQNRKNDFHCTSSIIHRFNRTAIVKFDAKNDAENRTGYYLEESHVASMQDSNYIRPHFTRDRLEPKIENFKRKYEPGELINLRCISAQYKSMPELYWLVDGLPVDPQFLDYKQSDYPQNGFVRLDLKYRIGQHISMNGVGLKRTLNRTIDSYTFKCVQVLSEVISVATEVAELFNFSELNGNSLDGNSVEAVKSLIGNGVQSIYTATVTTSFMLSLFVFFASKIWFAFNIDLHLF